MPAPILIIRGAPSAGKTTFANKLRGTENAFIFETDNFFIDSINRRDYHFDPKLLGIAHSWNQGEVIRACRDCPDVPVIVANTFSRPQEFQPYFEIAKMFNRKIFVFTLYTEHEHNAHGVPEKTIQKYRDNMHVFYMDMWVNDYPIVYSLNINSDEEAAKVAQLVHFKLFEK